jgi:hypothetical protein
MIKKSGRIIEEFERIWSAMRQVVPDLPDAVFTMAGGTDARRHYIKYGHFVPKQWHVDPDGDEWCEIFVGGEGLRRGGAAVLATLMHEATHALAHVRGIKDTSDHNQYHNQQFRDLAESTWPLHIETKHDRIGWSYTTLRENDAKEWQGYIDELDALIGEEHMYRIGPEESTGTPVAHRKRTVYACECGRQVHLTKDMIAHGGVLCGTCRHPFVEVTPDGESR